MSNGQIKPLKLLPQYVGTLKGILVSCLQSTERDLQKGTLLPNPNATQQQYAALSRLLGALYQEQITLPDEEALNSLQELAEATDKANEYAQVTLEHDALQDFLRQIRMEPS